MHWKASRPGSALVPTQKQTVQVCATVPSLLFLLLYELGNQFIKGIWCHLHWLQQEPSSELSRERTCVLSSFSRVQIFVTYGL